MNRRMLFVCAAGMLGAMLPVWSQQQYPLRYVTRNVVKADRTAEYEDIVKQNAAAAAKAGRETFSYVFRTAAGNTNEYWQISALAKFGDRDERPEWFKSIPAGESAARFARLRNCLEGSQASIDRVRDDMSIVTEGVPMKPYLRVLRTRVRVGKSEEFANLIKNELVPAYRRMGVKSLRVRQVAWGGSNYEFVSSVGFDKWSELDEPSLIVKALGEEGAQKFMDKLNPLIVNTEWLILRYMPDLSYVPPARPSASSQ